MSRRSDQVPGVQPALLVTAVILGLALLSASPVNGATGPDPAAPPCALGAGVVLAGTPLQLSGTTTSAEPVGVMAKAADGRFLEGTVRQGGGTWSALLTFGAGDAGSWNVEEVVDGTSCVSAISVALPPGVTAPPATVVSNPASAIDQGLDTEAVGSMLVMAIAILVIGSWLFLVLVAVAHLIGRAPLRGRSTRRLAQGSAVVAVVGAAMFVWFVADVVIGFSHFDSGIPPGEQALLDGGFWLALIGGAVLGLLAARRLGRGSSGAAATS